MTEHLPLSACVITLNEEKNISRCLKSAQWADEILVVDSGSQDRTVEIAKEHGARVLHNDWPGMVDQKQYATDQAQHDWILNLDADEWVSDELSRTIKNHFTSSLPSPKTSFKVNRLSKYLGEWMHHGSWHPDWLTRLFHRSQTGWSGNDPHGHVNPTDKTVKLSGVLYHQPYKDLSDHLEYINDYTDTMVDEKVKQNQTGSLWAALAHGGFKIVRDLFLKGGIMDGTRGIACAINGGFYTYLKYLKLWERTQNRSNNSIDQTVTGSDGE